MTKMTRWTLETSKPLLNIQYLEKKFGNFFCSCSVFFILYELAANLNNKMKTTHNRLNGKKNQWKKCYNYCLGNNTLVTLEDFSFAFFFFLCNLIRSTMSVRSPECTSITLFITFNHCVVSERKWLLSEP